MRYFLPDGYISREKFFLHLLELIKVLFNFLSENFVDLPKYSLAEMLWSDKSAIVDWRRPTPNQFPHVFLKGIFPLRRCHLLPGLEGPPLVATSPNEAMGGVR